MPQVIRTRTSQRMIFFLFDSGFVQTHFIGGFVINTHCGAR